MEYLQEPCFVYFKDYLKKRDNYGKNIIGILADTGERYLSVEGLYDGSE